MKKSLNLLLAFALVFSMFSTAVFAADSQSAAQKLVNAGIIKGSNSGDLMENETWKRQDVTVIISRLLGVEQEAKNTPKNHSFADVTDPYYDGFITYAYQNGYFNGHSEIRFGYGEEITVKQFAAVMLRVLGYDVAWDEVEEVAVEVGLVPAGTDFEEAATRGEYFVIIDTTLQTETADGEILGVALDLPGYAPETATDIASLKATGAKKLTVTFNGPVDVSKLDIDVKRDETVAVNVEETKASGNNTSVDIILTNPLLEGEYSVTVSGLGAESVSASVKVDDEKVTKVELNGDVAGMFLVPDTNDPTKEVVGGAKIGYKVYNQYGEDVTNKAIAGDVNWNASLTQSLDASNGILTLESEDFRRDQKVSVSAVVTNSNYVETFLITIGDVARVSKIENIELYHPEGKKLYTNSNFGQFQLLFEAYDQYGTKVDAAKFNTDVVVTTVSSYVNVDATNDVPNAQDSQGENGDKLGLALEAPTGAGLAGKTTITFIPKYGGTIAYFDLDIIAAARVERITLSRPAGTIAAGDTVEIPFTAVDQNGEEITDVDLLDDQVNLSPSTLRFEHDYAKDKAVLKYTAPRYKGINVLTAVVPRTGSNTQLTIDVKDPREAKVVSNVKDFNTVFAVGGVAAVDYKNIEVQDQYGKVLNLKDGNLFDQANNNYYKFFDPNKYRVKLEVADDTDNVIVFRPHASFDNDVTSVKSVVLTNTTDKYVVVAKATGTKRIKVSLLAWNGTAYEEVKGSAREFNIRVVNKNDIDSFKVDEIPTIYDDKAATTHRHKLNVYGLLGNQKVTIPNSIVSVTTSVYGVDVDTVASELNAFYLNASNVDDLNNDVREVKGQVIVTVDAKNGGTLTQEFTVSNRDPHIATVNLENDDNATSTKVRDGVLLVTVTNTGTLDITDLLKVFKAKDQYGKSIDLDHKRAPFLTFSNVKNHDNTGTINAVSGFVGAASVTGLDVRDSFTLTLTTNNGVVTTVKVVVEAKN